MIKIVFIVFMFSTLLNAQIMRYFPSFSANKTIVIAALKKDASSMCCIDRALWSDYDVAIAMVKADGNYFSYLAPYFNSTPLLNELGLIAIKTYPPVCLHHLFQNNKTLILEALKYVQITGRGFPMPPALSADDNFMIEAIQVWCGVLHQASPKLRSNYTLILKLAEKCPSICDASIELKSSYEIAIASLKHTGASSCISEGLKKDYTIASQLSHVQYLPPIYRMNYEIMFEIAKRDYTQLSGTHISLRSNKKFMIEIVKRDYRALQYAEPEIINDADFMIEILRHDIRAIEYADKNSRASFSIITAAVQNNGLNLMYASQNLRKNECVVRYAVINNGLALAYSLIVDFEIALEAVKSNGLALAYAQQLNTNYNIVLEAVKSNGLALQYASELLQCDNKIVKIAVENNGLSLEYACYTLKTDRNIVIAAIRSNGLAIQYANPIFRQDYSIALIAVGIY